MGASIHINGTKSSVVDTIFVCRTTGTIRASRFDTSSDTIEQLLRTDLENLQLAGLAPRAGESCCLLFGHLTRLATWRLRPNWHSHIATAEKLGQIRTTLQRIYPLDLLPQLAARTLASLSELDPLASMRLQEVQPTYAPDDTISF
jgi:hypothetical protein